MGGKKRPTLSQLVKKMEREKEKQEKRAQAEERKGKVALVDDKLFEEIKRDVLNMNCVTSYTIASKYGIKISTATHILRALRDQGVLYLLSKGHRTEIYVPVERAKALGLLRT